MGRINLSGYGSSNLPSRERWEEMAEILYGDGSGKKDDRRVGTQRGRRRNRRPTLLNGGLTTEGSLPPSERTIDPGILYNTEDHTKPHPLSPSALGSGNAQMDWAMQQNLVNAPKGQSPKKLTATKYDPSKYYTPNLVFDSSSTVKNNIKKGVKNYAPNTYKSIRVIAGESGMEIPKDFSEKDVGDILITIAHLETDVGKNNQPSSKGARQLMQIMPKTAGDIVNTKSAMLNLTQTQITKDPASNVRAAKWLIFKDMARRWKGTDDYLGFVAMEYNAGIEAINRARTNVLIKGNQGDEEIIAKVEKKMPLQTRKYLRQFRYVLNLVRQGKPVPSNFRDLAIKFSPL